MREIETVRERERERETERDRERQRKRERERERESANQYTSVNLLYCKNNSVKELISACKDI